MASDISPSPQAADTGVSAEAPFLTMINGYFAEAKCQELLEEILGVELLGIGHDYYDMSFEIYPAEDVKEVEISEAMNEKILALGCSRYWVNYPDSTQRYGRGERVKVLSNRWEAFNNNVVSRRTAMLAGAAGGQAEPVAYQYRHYHNDGAPGWGAWRECNRVEFETLCHRISGTETRCLYTAPPPTVGAPQGVTDAEVRKAYFASHLLEDRGQRLRPHIAGAMRRALESFAASRLVAGALPADSRRSAYARGFYAAAGWAQRPDLYADIGSPAYVKQMESLLGTATPPSAALATPSPAQAEPTNDPLPCPNCDGEGSVMVPSDNGPDAYDVAIDCPHCDGKQTLEDAYHGVVKLLDREQKAHQKTYSIIWGHYGTVKGEALQNQIKRIAENVKPEHIDWVHDRLNDLAQSAAGYLATGAAEGAEPTADAERLDFVLSAIVADEAKIIAILHDEEGFSLSRERMLENIDTARAAIDAARAAQKGGV